MDFCNNLHVFIIISYLFSQIMCLILLLDIDLKNRFIESAKLHFILGFFDIFIMQFNFEVFLATFFVFQILMYFKKKF